MIQFDIPGVKSFSAEHLVLDYNGTLATDGIIMHGIREKLFELSDRLNIHIVTADTYGMVTANLEGIKCEIAIIGNGHQAEHKKEYVKSLGCETVIAIGNGTNDSEMVKCAVLGISVIHKEGACPKTVINSDIVCTNVLDAFDLVLNQKRVSATLRE